VRRTAIILGALALVAVVLATSVLTHGSGHSSGGGAPTTGRVPVPGRAPPLLEAGRVPVPGRIPPLLAADDVYAAGRPGSLSPAVRGNPALVYVPNSKSDSVDVISQRTFRVVRHFKTGALPQHVTPSWDLKRLWVDNDVGNTLTPIDPNTGRPGRPVAVTDPYNLYFTADGRRAIVVAEAKRELDFREPRTMRLTHALKVPQCPGVDHMDYTADGRLALASCEFSGQALVIDLVRERVVKTVTLKPGGMPQDVKLAPAGDRFYVADMTAGGVWVVDAAKMKRVGFVHTGKGAHGLYTSRDSRRMYVTNRDEGSVSVLSMATGKVIATWRIPGGGSPDMGGLSANGRTLWLSGRYDAVVYAISTRTGKVLHRVRVGAGPHGLCVWPQPGRYSIGHTGILR